MVLRPSTKISDAYTKVIEYVKSLGKEECLKSLSKIFGYGIGLVKREELLTLKSDNHRIIEESMVFNIRVSMANFDSRANRNCLLVADTVFVGKDQTEILTNEKKKDFSEISYQIDENEEELPSDDDGENQKMAESRSRSELKKKVKNEMIDTGKLSGVGVI